MGDDTQAERHQLQRWYRRVRGRPVVPMGSGAAQRDVEGEVGTRWQRRSPLSSATVLNQHVWGSPHIQRPGFRGKLQGSFKRERDSSVKCEGVLGASVFPGRRERDSGTNCEEVLSESAILE